jgi:hypothetical protein
LKLKKQEKSVNPKMKSKKKKRGIEKKRTLVRVVNEISALHCSVFIAPVPDGDSAERMLKLELGFRILGLW